MGTKYIDRETFYQSLKFWRKLWDMSFVESCCNHESCGFCRMPGNELIMKMFSVRLIII